MSEDRQAENCETTIKNFTNKDLGVEGDVEFQNVHRLRQRVDRKLRNIIAKFTKYTDHEKVRTAAFEKLKGRKDFVVFQQYPAEIRAHRKELILQMQDGATGTHLSQASIGPPQAHPVMRPTAPSFVPMGQQFVSPYPQGR